MFGGYVVVGRNTIGSDPSLVAGPFPTREDAEEFLTELAEATKGRYVVLSLHTPEPKEQ